MCGHSPPPGPSRVTFNRNLLNKNMPAVKRLPLTRTSRLLIIHFEVLEYCLVLIYAVSIKLGELFDRYGDFPYQSCQLTWIICRKARVHVMGGRVL